MGDIQLLMALNQKPILAQRIRVITLGIVRDLQVLMALTKKPIPTLGTRVIAQ